MLARFFIILLIFNVAGCVSSTAKYAKDSGQIVSLPDARTRILTYHESGQYLLDVKKRTREIAAAVEKAYAAGVKYPAVVMVVEDVLVSTYNVRRKQVFSDNKCASKELDSNVILGLLPVIEPSLNLYEYLLSRRIPVFLISHRPENMRVSILENLAGAGYAGWSALYLLPPKYENDSSGFSEEVRRGLKATGINIIATVGVLPSDIVGESEEARFLYPNYIYSSR